MKQQLKTKLLIFLFLISMVIVKTGVGQILPPSTVTTLPNNSSFQSGIELNNSEQWFKFTTDSIHVSVKVKLEEQGVNNSLSKFELYNDAGGGLIQIVFTDTLRTDSTMWVSATFLNPTTDIYVRVSSITQPCATCSGSNYPKISMDVMALQAGCNTYVQPPCQYVKDTSFEYATLPCSSIPNPNNGACWNDPYVGFANCFWNMPLANSLVNCGGLGSLASLGTSDYYCTGGHTGSGCAGIFLYTQTNPTPTTYGERNYREYITETLFTPLTTGKTYSLTIWVKRNPTKSFATSNIEVALSNGIYTQNSFNAIVSPAGQIIPMASSIITSPNWTKLTTVFAATGNYSQITIGNFTGVGSSIVANVTPSVNITQDRAAYYFVDDVSILETFTTSVTNPVCLGLGTATINVIQSNAGTSYTWTSSPLTPTLITVSGSSVVVSPTVSTNYTVFTTNTLGCIMSNTVDVLTTPITFTATSYTFCPGAPLSITVTATGLTTYTWVPNPTITGSLNSPTITVSPTTTTTYTVFGNLTGCPNTYFSTVTITDISPTIGISISSIVCVGSMVTVTSTPTYSITYLDFESGLYISTPNPYTYSSVGNYTIDVGSEDPVSGCTSYSFFPISVVPASNPTLTISPSQTICAGQTTTLNVSGATSYTWSTSANTNSIVVNPTNTTTYTVIGETTCGTATAQVTVFIASPPTIAVNNATICSGKSATLTASGASSYTWMPGSLTGSVITVNPSTTTVYTITGVNSLGCNSTQTATVTILSLAKIGVAASPSVICYGQNSTLSASGALSYTWNPGAATGSVIIVSPTVTTLYTVSATNSNGCVNTRTISITVNPLPTLSVAASPTIVCLSSSTLSAAGATTYSWSTGTTSSTLAVSPSVTTTYTVIGTNSSGCSSSSTVTVMYGPVSPIITVSSNSNIVCSGSTTLTASGGASYTWSPGNVSSPTIAVSPSVATVYTITSTIGSGCGTYTFTSIVNPQASTLCCNAPNMTIGASLTSSVNMASGTYAVAGTVIDMQGVITFTGNTSFNGYTFRMKPGTLLRVVGEYTLSLINCKLFSCSELWNGISLPALNNDIHGHLLLNNTTVEDMYNGIVVEGNAWPVVTPTTGILISSTNSKLNKNYISIQMRNIDGMFYTPTMSYTSTPYPFSIITTTMSSYASATSPGSTLKPSTTYTYAYNTWAGGATSSTNPPFVNFPRTYTGIALNNMKAMSPLIIGDSVNTGNTNTFDNMDFGITGTEATIKVHNNYFKNITGSTKQSALDPEFSPPAFGPDEIGIAVAMSHTTTNIQLLTVGTKTTVPSTGNPYPKGNVFEDCNKAIKAVSCKNVYVKGNQFNATTTSTISPPVNAYYYYKNQQAIWVSALSDENNISYNYIRNFANGIYSSHTFSLTTPRPIVNYNDIAAPLSTGYCKQAIQISQVGGANMGNGSYSLLTNRIANVYNGISCNGVPNGLNIYGNDVSIESMTKILGTTATATRTAISLNTCQYGQVRGNTVYSNVSPVPTTSTTAGYLTGIGITNSANSRVECNLAHTTGRDFVFQGGCSGTKWLANTMQNSYRGLEMRLAAVIGMQGGPTYTGTPNLSANTWTTITQETYVLGTTNVNSLSKLYLLSGGSPRTQPILNFASTAIQVYTNTPGAGINTVTGTSYTCNVGTAQRMANSSNNNSNSTVNNQRTSEAGDSLVEYTNLVTTDENTYEVFTDEFEYLNKQLVYKLVEQDSINPANGSTLDDFYDANQNSAIDKLTEVQTAIANNDVSSANSVNNSVPTTNQVEYKHQRANELTLKYMNDRNYIFTSNERSDLYNMANECIVKGYYVVQARNIVDIITNQAISYDDNCEAEANASRKTKIEKTEIASYSAFNLFPNPNNGSMQLDYDLGGYANAEFKLYDITGKLINSYKLQNSKGIMQMNEQNLHNGIYFYHILEGEKTIKTDKIVIIK